jgi:hypothetical protein
VLGKLDRPVGMRTHSTQAPGDFEVPRSVITEAVVNAVAHRDYRNTGFVQVIVYANRIEVWNPGEQPQGLTPEKLRHPHAPMPRNPLLAEPLYRVKFVEKAGTGTTDMIEDCRAAGLPEPTFEYQSLFECSRRTAARDMDDLFNKAILKREGAGHATRYVLAPNRAKIVPIMPGGLPPVDIGHLSDIFAIQPETISTNRLTFDSPENRDAMETPNPKRTRHDGYGIGQDVFQCAEYQCVTICRRGSPTRHSCFEQPYRYGTFIGHMRRHPGSRSVAAEFAGSPTFPAGMSMHLEKSNPHPHLSFLLCCIHPSRVISFAHSF